MEYDLLAYDSNTALVHIVLARVVRQTLALLRVLLHLVWTRIAVQTARLMSLQARAIPPEVHLSL